MSNDSVMIDLETLGLTADAVILSIGAVRFDLDSDTLDDAGFYASISLESNMDAGRTINGDTLKWWMGQSAEVKEVFSEAKEELEPVLLSLATWFGESTYVWSNGADFDIPMIAHAFGQFGIPVPWKFWNARCVRTYKNLPGAKNIKVPNATKHNALHDAIAQVRLVQAIQQRLFTVKHPMVKA